MSLTTVGMTREEMTERLARYRDFHLIQPVRVSAEYGATLGWVCRHDSVRILQKTDGDWRHDPDEIKALAEGADQWALSTHDMKQKRPPKPRRINLPITVDEDLRAAIGYRFGKDRATEADIRSALEGALDGWLTDVMSEWREGLPPGAASQFESDGEES